MPPSPLASPRFLKSQGFLPLSNQMESEADIPLAPIRTTSSVGARKHNQTTVGLNRIASSGYDGSDSVDEKHTIFRRPSNLPAGRRRIKNDPSPMVSRSSTDSSISLNFMGKLYTRIMSESFVTRYLIYVIPVAFLFAIPLVVLPLTDNTKNIPLGHHTDKTTTPHTTIAGPPLFHLFIWLETAWVTLWTAKLVAYLLPALFMFFCGVVSSGTRKYATVLRALEIPLSLFFWALASWLVFKFLFVNNNFEWVYVIKQILGSLYVSSAVFLVEKAIVQLISISYHQRSFANRIKQSKHDIHLLGLMYEASRALFPMYCPEFADEDYFINDSIDMMLNSTRKMHKKSRSVAPMHLIGNVGRIGDKVTSVFGNLASEITGKQVFNPTSAHSIVVEALEKVRTSEAMARRIWMSFVVEDSDSLSPEDIEEVLGPAHKLEAEECFIAIDADGNGDISLQEMIRKVVDIGKERKAISNSMKDISQALAVFDNVLIFCVLLITIFIFLAFFQSSFISTLTTAGTSLLSLSFIFSVTSQEFLGSCIFLFVKHPYDVGDRVDINGPEKEELIVEKISLLYTVFVRIDKMQVVQVPNIQLNNLWIENVTRSNAEREVIDVSVSYDTSFEDIELLRLEMEQFVRHPDNARDFQPDLSISVGSVNNLDKLTLNIAIKHKSNWHNELVRATRRSKFMCALALALKKVPIYAPGGGSDALGSPANPTYSVAVSDATAAEARQQAKNSKDALRLVPLLDLDGDEDEDEDEDGNRNDGSGNRSAEKQAVRDLHTTIPPTNAAEGWGAALDDHTLNESATRSRVSSLDGGSGDGMRPSLSLSRAKSQAKSQSRSKSQASRKQLRKQESLQQLQDLRSELINKNKSQRGRRQAGTGASLAPSDALAGALGEDISYSSHIARKPSSASYRSAMSFDIERTASGSGTDGNRFAIPPPSVAPPSAAATGAYTTYPLHMAASSSSASPSASRALHPLQSAPTEGSASASGANVSRTQQ
ncbi:serine/threonine-protein kinase [Grosmannia clavigera kw1407]|uniref:Serine/threonine-protein kinase n=1 Tax=Grosmannia clavigera (strain kw1407 / UAMH 11150) TaxID=655863 RepID=F0XA27_GROCL|nr:serine/threonine-protein kinase [Grosmannia clavigera kw1407]EFX05491.1 serine/threonine-protein kinase [Grosmannia clavigera kw1407]